MSFHINKRTMAGVCGFIKVFGVLILSLFFWISRSESSPSKNSFIPHVEAEKNQDLEAELSSQISKKLGVIIQVQDREELKKIFKVSRGHQVLSPTQGLYEVHGVSLEYIQKNHPSVVAEKNQWIETTTQTPKTPGKEVSAETPDGEVSAEAPDKEEIQKGDSPPSSPHVVEKIKIPLNTGFDQLNKLDIRHCKFPNNSLENLEKIPLIRLRPQSYHFEDTYQLSETVVLSANGSQSHPQNPQKIKYRWFVRSPAISRIPNYNKKKQGKKIFRITPDVPGTYIVTVVGFFPKTGMCWGKDYKFHVAYNPDFLWKDEWSRPAPVEEEKHWNLPHLDLLDAQSAWQVSTGKDVRIAFLGSGIDYNNPTFRYNLAFNEDEVENGQDTDGNGFRDDVLGWDFVHGDNKPFDEDNHETPVVALSSSRDFGLAKDSKIIPIRIRDKMSYLLGAIYYAVDRKAQIISWSGASHINRSFGPKPPRNVLFHKALAWARDHGVLFVRASGNEPYNLNNPFFYSSSLEVKFGNIISVGATDFDGNLTHYSTFGSSYVDVATLGGTPNQPLFSVVPQNPFQLSFQGLYGTSFSTPLVSAMAALLLEIDPDLTPGEIREILMESGKEVERLKSKVASGRFVDPVSVIETLFTRKPELLERENFRWIREAQLPPSKRPEFLKPK